MKRIVFFALCASISFAASAGPCQENYHAFEHARGNTCIPLKPERVASLRDDSVTTPLLDLGAPVFATVMRDMKGGPRYVRGASDIFGQDYVDAAELIDLGGHNPPDIEAVATAKPDLIILRQYQADLLEQLQVIAPAIVIPDNMPFLEHIQWLAKAVGMEETYDTRLARYDSRIAHAKSVIGSAENIIVSRLDIWEDGLWYYPNWGAIDQVINDIGFDKPDIQAEATQSMNGISVERLLEFDGDLILSSTAPRFGQTISLLEEQWDDIAPFWKQLSGVQRGNLFWYERDILVGYTFSSLHRSIDYLTALTAGRHFDS